jgi:2-octaprenyl-6-methoxyphenol hydroxylase
MLSQRKQGTLGCQAAARPKRKSMSARDTEQTFDIVIAGASFTGLTLARSLGLALGGEARIAIIDRQQVPGTGRSPDPRAYAISAGSRRMLDALGVWRELESAAQAVERIDITDSRLENAIRPVLLSYDNHVLDGPATWIVEASRLKSALEEAALNTPGIEVLAPAAISELSANTERHACLALEGGKTLRARLIAACDGRLSPIREAAGIKTVSWPHAQIGIVTTVTHQRPHQNRAIQHFLPAGPFAILPMTHNRSCITWTEEESRARAILELGEPEFLEEVERRFGHRLGALSLGGGRAGWPLEFRMARNLVAARVALVGDAVRSVHPIAGQGLNLGLRDVAALTECVADSMRLGLDPGDAMSLERYARWRHFDSVASAAAFEAIDRLFSSDSRLLRTARDVGLGIVDRLPGLKSAIVSEASGDTGEPPRLLRGEMA